MYRWADGKRVCVIFTTTGGQELICLPGDTEINTRQAMWGCEREGNIPKHTITYIAKESARERKAKWHLHTCGGGELLCVCLFSVSL